MRRPVPATIMCAPAVAGVALDHVSTSSSLPPHARISAAVAVFLRRRPNPCTSHFHSHSVWARFRPVHDEVHGGWVLQSLRRTDLSRGRPRNATQSPGQDVWPPKRLVVLLGSPQGIGWCGEGVRSGAGEGFPRSRCVLQVTGHMGWQLASGRRSFWRWRRRHVAEDRTLVRWSTADGGARQAFARRR